VLALRAFGPLVRERVEGAGDGTAGFARVDDVVDVAALRGDERVGEVVGVLRGFRLGIGASGISGG